MGVLRKLLKKSGLFLTGEVGASKREEKDKSYLMILSERRERC